MKKRVRTKGGKVPLGQVVNKREDKIVDKMIDKSSQGCFVKIRVLVSVNIKII